MKKIVATFNEREGKVIYQASENISKEKLSRALTKEGLVQDLFSGRKFSGEKFRINQKVKNIIRILEMSK